VGGILFNCVNYNALTNLHICLVTIFKYLGFAYPLLAIVIDLFCWERSPSFHILIHTVIPIFDRQSFFSTITYNCL